MPRSRTITLAVAADIKAYAAELAKVPGITEKQASAAALRWAAAQQKIATAADTQVSAWTRITEFATGSVIGQMATRAGDALLGAARATMQWAIDAERAHDAVMDLAQDTGLATDTIDAMRLAARREGESLEEVTGWINKFAKGVKDAAEGGGKLAPVLRDLGVETRSQIDGSWRPLDDVFREVVDKLQDVEDQTVRTALAQKLGGQEAAALMRSLGDKRLLEYVDLAHRLGVDTATVADQTAAWEDGLNQLGVAADVAGNALYRAFGQDGGGGAIKLLTDGTLLFAATAEEVADRVRQRWEDIPGAIAKALAKQLINLTPGVNLAAWIFEDAKARFGDAGAEAGDGIFDGIVEQIRARKHDYDAALGDLFSGKSGGGMARSVLPVEQVADGAVKITDNLNDLADEMGVLQEAWSTVFASEDDDPLQRQIDQWEALKGKVMDAAMALDSYGESSIIVGEIDKRQAALRNQQAAEVAAKDAAAQAQILESRQAVATASMQLGSAVTEMVMSGLQQQGEETSSAYRALFLLSRAFALADIAVKTEQAIMAAMTLPPPASYALAVAAGITGAASAATVVGTALTMHSGGSVPGVRGVMPDEPLIKALPGEMIVSQPQVERAGGPSGVRRALDGGGGGNTYNLVLGNRHLRMIAEDVTSSVAAAIRGRPLGWAT